MRDFSNARHSNLEIKASFIEPSLTIQTGAQFDIFCVGFHHHFLDDAACSIRFEFRVTILGFSFALGYIKLYK